MLRRSLRTGARLRGKQPEPTWRQVLAHIGAVRTAFDVSTTPDLVLGAEALCFAPEPAERRRVAAALRAWGSAEVIPVVALRDEDGWRASWEAQLDAWAPEIDGERGTDDVLGDRYFDAEAVVAFWSHFGDVRCVDYGDAVTEHGSVVPALVTALGRRSGLLTKDHRLNPRRAAD